MWRKASSGETGQHRPTINAPLRIHVDDPLASELLALGLLSKFRLHNVHRDHEIVVVCIGTDRSTGDALGPLTGTNLHRMNLPDTHVYGTLAKPVHATNLQETLEQLEQCHPAAFVMALDACLGKSESVGYISIKEGPLKPGTGVNKKLPTIGHLHLIGVVNVGGFMEYFVLQNTRLGLVYQMAETMAKAIATCISQTRKPSFELETVDRTTWREAAAQHLPEE